MIPELRIERSTYHTGSSQDVSSIAVQADFSGENGEAEEGKRIQLDLTEPFLFSDAALIVEGHQLHCHRAILSLYSPVFKTMFTSNFLESENKEVVIHDASLADVKDMLDIMYNVEEVEMSRETAQRLLPLLHRYQVTSLISIAERVLTSRMTDRLAPTYFQLADTFDLKQLRKAAIESCSRLDMTRLREVLSSETEVQISPELQSEIYERRIEFLESCLTDIQRCFTHSCTRVEGRMERVPANHCKQHSRPFEPVVMTTPVATTNSMSSPQQPITINGVASGNGHQDPMQQQRPPGMRLDVGASIIPPGLPSNDEQPVGSGRQGLDATNGGPDQPQSLVHQQTAVCERCVEQMKNYIIELCKRGLHKVPIIMCTQ